MLYTTPLPPLPPSTRRALPADVLSRPIPADWPFAPSLSERQNTRQRDDARHTLGAAHGRALARRFTGAAITGFGEFA